MFKAFAFLLSLMSSQIVFAVPLSDKQSHEQLELQQRWQIEAERYFSVQTMASGSCRLAIAVPDRPTQGIVTLTFDDGPRRESTGKILDILKSYNIRATFFVLSSKVAGNEDLIQRMLSEGHIVANHSRSHANACAVSNNDFIRNQIDVSDRLLNPYLSPTKFFRFPYGNSTVATQAYVRDLGYNIVGWHIDSCDWAYAANGVIPMNPRTRQPTCLSKQAYQTYASNYGGWVVSEVNRLGGGVVLMHDIHDRTADNLQGIISRLQAQNFRFVGLDERAYFPQLNR